MANISAFRGLRYNSKKVKNLSRVFAPPYDIISPAEQKQLYKQHPRNIVRLDFGIVKSSDTAEENRYSRAAKTLAQWIKDKTLVYDETPSIYVYRQEYTVDSQKKARLGFVANFMFSGKKNDGCLPHEHTLAKPKVDRLSLIRNVKANLSPIFSFYIDDKKSVDRVLSACLKQRPLVSFKDADNIRHCFWKIADPEKIRKIEQLMADKKIFIADGHHRYEVSYNYWKESIGQGPAADSVMMYFTAFSEDNLCVLPTHRMVRDIPGLKEKIELLRRCFQVREMKDLKNLSREQAKSRGFALGMYYDNKFYLLEMTDKKLLERLMQKSPKQWRKLDVAMLNTIVFKHIFKFSEAEKEEKVTYTRDAAEAIQAVDKNLARIAFFPNATKAAQVKDIALSGSRMPQKSTYFYPKPITGLVINKF